MNSIKACSLLMFFSLFFRLSAQDVKYSRNYVDHIRSIQLYPKGNELGSPYFELGSRNSLVLHFDDLIPDVKSYQYSLLHCNADWSPSNLLQGEYMQGFYEENITNYDFSFNTLVSYIHYKVEVPSENITLTKSGNYLLKVYEVGKRDEPSFTVRMVVYENKAGIYPNIKMSDYVQFRDQNQEVDFRVVPTMPIMNGSSEVKASILQNNRWEKSIIGLKPSFVRENDFIFDYSREAMFPGGNEYRYMDLKSLRYRTERVALIQREENTHLVRLVDDRIRKGIPYTGYQDINGRYVVRNDDMQGNGEINADYVLVKFILRAPEPFSGSTLFLYGDLAFQPFSERYLMKYNYETSSYELDLLLKQGYYSYSYVLVDGKKNVETSETEGDFSQTENDYTIILYHRDFGSDYDRVIGLSMVNSRGRF